ncbi:MAG: hypothetical protein AAFY11_01845 [Cyanobacteria bacterium J06641_5]
MPAEHLRAVLNKVGSPIVKPNPTDIDAIEMAIALTLPVLKPMSSRDRLR